jgi:carbohydrate-selective porin OprB
MQGAMRVGRVLRTAIIVVAIAALLRDAATAASPLDEQSQTSAPGETAPSLPDFLSQLTDPGGFRSRLERAGLQFTFTYYGDGFANLQGGVSQGVGYAGRLGTLVDADLERLIDWSGATLARQRSPDLQHPI